MKGQLQLDTFVLIETRVSCELSLNPDQPISPWIIMSTPD
jgi:hypothetical protein